MGEKTLKIGLKWILFMKDDRTQGAGNVWEDDREFNIFSKISKNRLKKYKNKGKDNEERQQRRNEVSVELRKNKSDDTLRKQQTVDSRVVHRQNIEWNPGEQRTQTAPSHAVYKEESCSL